MFIRCDASSSDREAPVEDAFIALIRLAPTTLLFLSTSRVLIIDLKVPLSVVGVKGERVL